MTDRCCKTCRHWDRASAEDKAGRVRNNWGAPCSWQGKDEWLSMLPLPYWLENEIRGIKRPLLLIASSGKGCRGWEGRNG